MELGAFSVSLGVADIHRSREFYRKLGFVEVGGDVEQNWLILRNGAATIGLFQGMFEGNLLTFNPGWSPAAETLEEFTDVRRLQQALVEAGIEIESNVDGAEEGPGSFTVIDPDGNAILVDQHV